MQFAFSRALFICALCAFAAAKQPQQQQQQQQSQQQPQPLQQQQKQAQSTKLKRDAGLSFGSGLYHGPSHKYLPPAASSGGYESTYAHLHGNGLAASSGFDFASLDTDSSHQGPLHHHYQQPQLHHHHQPYHSPQHHHHYSHQPHTYQSLGSYHGHGRPVYISSSSLTGGPAAGPGPSYHQRPPKVETYIVHTSNGGGGSSGGHGFGQQGHSGYKYSGHGGSPSYLSLLGGASHKQHGGSSTTYLLTTPSYSSSGSSGSLGSNSLSLGSLGSLGSGGSSHGISFGHGHPLSLGSSSSGGSSSSHGLSFAPALDHEQHLGYSYEPPSLQHYAKQPLNSYGVPLLAGYEHGQPEEEHQQQQPQQHHELHHEEQQLPAEKSHTEQQTPAYALGHKGLGHFSYTSSKPLALNTDIHQHEDQNELVAELAKAPFKPSAFLGAKHESSLGYSDYATPTTQYLQPPTATGYDYAAPGPSVLYGAPGQSGDSATPIFEPDSTYLPPTHNYH
ncbi:PREDICTED: protein ovo [Drosophila arizonae]|uniref:Protein ovo n=1 Tax=Drosophila arizonae TaxID=7263 RepID=A0ABM1PSN2_DROAR|nr:PREDICTED: protein ovo [Drosophila arizonae]